MKHLPLALAVLMIALVALWAWDLSRGPGDLDLRPQPDWPEALADWKPEEGPGRLSGRLLAADGAPNASALVQVETPGGPLWTRTDTLGRFDLNGLPDTGQAPLWVTVLAFEHLPKRFTLEPDAAPTWEVEWRLEPPPAELPALPPLEVEDFLGRIVRPRGETLGLEVRLLPPPGTDMLTGAVERRARVHADGTFRVPSLAAGVYQAQVLPAWASGGTWPVIGTGVVSVAPRSSMPAPPPLQVTEAQVFGTVRTPDGAPLVGAMVVLRDESAPGRLCPPLATDPVGSFTFTGLPAGNYTLDIVSGLTRHTQGVELAANADAVLDITLELGPLSSGDA